MRGWAGNRRGSMNCKAQHDKLVMDLRQSLLETLEEIQYLRATARRSAEVNAT